MSETSPSSTARPRPLRLFTPGPAGAGAGTFPLVFVKVAVLLATVAIAGCTPTTGPGEASLPTVPTEALATLDGGPFDGDAATLDLLTFNTALLPLGDEQVRARRVEAMAPYLAGYDLLVLQEAFATGATERLLASIDEVYPYRTEVLAASDRGAWPPTSGGVLVASQWPIVDVQETRFGAVCSGTDCLADKGFVFVTVDVEGANLHLIATHLQSEWGGEAAAEVRARQADLIAAFVDAAGVPASEPLLIAGDLNVVQASDEAGPFFDRLRATVPPREGPLAFTWDPLLNPRAYGDREWIDYVTWSTDHLEPDGAWQRALVLRDGSDDLSDHYAVWGRLTFSGR